MIHFKLTNLAIHLKAVRDIDFTPRRADEGSAGYDLKACLVEDSISIWPDEAVKIPTGVHVWIGEMKEYTYDEPTMQFAGLYLPRSSSPGLMLTNTVGLLDSSYQGESFLKYRNMSNEVITIERGDKIGQLVIFPSYIGTMIEVEEFDEVTIRGEGGFGSTGVK